MEHKISIKKIEYVTHNVLHIVADKPRNYSFTPGQATELSIDKDGYRNDKRPFTFTSLPQDNELEFTIKIYPSHEGVTDQLQYLKTNDNLFIGDAWGAINYQGEGTFIAGGAGITPFIAILKDLRYKGHLGNNKLFFSNHEEKDIIYKNNLETWMGKNLHVILSKENHNDYHYGHVNKDLLQKYNLDVSKPVYLCGPPKMVEAITSDLYKMGLSKSHLITEEA